MTLACARGCAAVLGLGLCATGAAAQNPGTAPPTVIQTIGAQRLPTSSVSLIVVDPQDGRVVASLNGAVPRSPASTVKVLTTYASLDILGPAYTWRTRALTRGELDNGTLQGDLILQGGGDPFMSIERWWSFARALRSKGLRVIHGNILIDDKQFAPQTDDPGAFDGRPHRNYNVLPYAMMVNFQSIEFRLVPNAVTRKVDIQTDPAPVNLIIDNRVRFSSARCSGPSRRVDFDVDSQNGNRVSFTGALSQSCAPRSFSRVLMSPADYAFGTFVAIWRELGGEFDGTLNLGATAGDARPLLSFDSLSLSEIVRLTNKFSSNLMARHLLLTLGLEKFGAPSTAEKGAQAIADWSRERGISLQDVDIDNGSGLSRTTRVTVSELANVLNLAYHSRFAPEFLSSLPLAGMDGTLRSRLREVPAGAVRLKTGHLNGVSGVAGYVTANSGKTYIVVSLVNHQRTDVGAGEPVHEALVDWILETL